MDILKPDPSKPFMSAFKIVLVIAMIVGIIVGVMDGFLGFETNLMEHAGPAFGLALVALYFYFRFRA